jgi:hypothetical protein
MKIKSILIYFLVLLFSTQEILTCTCVGGQYVKDKLKLSNLVIIGKVLNYEKIEIVDTLFKEGTKKRDGKIISPIFLKSYYIKFNIEKLKLLKGKYKLDTIQVFSRNGNGTCGSVFEENTTYVLYLQKGRIFSKIFDGIKEYYSTNICMGNTMEVESELKKILKYLKLKKSK